MVDAPKKLGQLIEIVNLVPPSYEMADLFGMLRYADQGEPGWATIADAALENCLKSAPEALRRYVRPFVEGDFDPICEIEHSVQSYIELREARKRLSAIARRAKGLQPTQSAILSRSDSFRLQWFEIDEYGYVRSKNNKDLLTEALEEIDDDGKLINVEAQRIRECVVCDCIFWAGRLDKIACGEKCSRRVSTDKWRNKYSAPEGYKERRLGYSTVSAKTGRPKISEATKRTRTTIKKKRR